MAHLVLENVLKRFKFSVFLKTRLGKYLFEEKITVKIWKTPMSQTGPCYQKKKAISLEPYFFFFGIGMG